MATATVAPTSLSRVQLAGGQRDADATATPADDAGTNHQTRTDWAESTELAGALVA